MANPAIFEGGFADPALQSSLAFRSAMTTMARPGTIATLEGGDGPAPLSAAAATLILLLCDPDTGLSLHGACDSEDIRHWVTFHTAAPIVPAETASFAMGTWDSLQPPGRFAVGTPDYPDRSCTLIVELDELIHDGARLSGPGIDPNRSEPALLNLPKTAFFADNRARFPLGLDCYFTAGSKVAALPRSTHVSFEQDMAEGVEVA